MSYPMIHQQIKVENEALGHVTRALEVAIAWEVKGPDLSRKLSSVRFAIELFQRQVERLFALEELDGYMVRVSRARPEWSDQIEELRQEHDQCRAAIRRAVIQLDHASPTDVGQLDAICEALRDVMLRLVQHGHRENEMVVESVNLDIGGEG